MDDNVIDIVDAAAAYDGISVFSDLHLRIQHGERWGIIGKNGTGKSTLVKMIVGLLRPAAGKIVVNGMDIRVYKSKDRAKTIAYVPQKPDGIIPYTVHDYVLLGRYASTGLFGISSQADLDVVHDALDLCDVAHLAERSTATLSGGELQRVILAGAVVQQSPILVLDEPTTFLDPAHERMFLGALDKVHKQRAMSVVMVTHDVNTALSYCTHICALKDGGICFSGTSDDFRAQCPKLLDTVFGVPFYVFTSGNNKHTAFGTWGHSLS